MLLGIFVARVPAVGEVMVARRATALTAALGALCLGLSAFVGVSGSAGASVGSDRAQIAKLQKQIEDQGARVKSLVGQYDQVQGHIAQLDVQISADRAVLSRDNRAETVGITALRRVAIAAYVTGVGMDSPTLNLFSDSTSINTLLEQNQYLGAVNSRLTGALDTVRLDQDQVKTDQGNLESQQKVAKTALHQLTRAHNAAQSAIAKDQTMLLRVGGNLRSLLQAATQKSEAEEQASERALATRPIPVTPTPGPTFAVLPALVPKASSSPSTTVPPAPPTTVPPPPSSSGSYANPLRAVAALNPERIDQGVDYSGFGPIYAIGNGVVLGTVNGGWPGGTFIVYRLTDGPARGDLVYAAEDIDPSIQVGATVTSNTVLGQVYAGPDGIETGWADPNALGNTMARDAGQFDGDNSTAFGANFSQLLQSLGAPGGVLQTNPPTGNLPGTWPRW